MKILHVTEAALGGTSKHLLDLSGAQARQGHDVTVAWSDRRAEPKFVSEVATLSTVRSEIIRIDREISPPSDIASYFRLLRFLRSTGPYDVIHSHSSKAGALARLLPKRYAGAFIYTPHAFRTQDPSISRKGKLAFGMAERFLARYASKIIVLSSHEEAHALDALRIDPSKIKLIRNGAGPDHSTSRSEARESLGLSDNEIAVGFIGRLSHQKNPQRFINAIRIASASCPNLVGLMLGDGELRAECEELALGAPVRFLGWQDGPKLIKGFDVYCMTSLYEGFPYTLLEALHAGVPIVTTDIGGAREAVEPARNGEILPVDASAQEIAEILVALASDEGRRKSFGREALRRAQQFTVDCMVDETVALYNRAMAGS